MNQGKKRKKRRTDLYRLLLAALLIFCTAVQVPAAAADGHVLSYGVAGMRQRKTGSTVSADVSTDALPSKYNAVRKGYVTSVKKQDPYGTCSHFSVICALEASAIKNHVVVNGQTAAADNIDLSEFQLLYFFYNRKKDPLGGTQGDRTRAGNNFYYIGGNCTMNGLHLLSWCGAADEEDAPYKNAGSKLPYSLAYASDSVHVQGMELASPDTDRKHLKRMIMQYGAATLTLSFDYADFNTKKNALYCDDYSPVDHAVTVVGWNDSYSRRNFLTKPKHNGAWLCKNQWGKKFGHNGYFWVSYDDTTIGFEMACAFQVESADNYKYNYQYDGGTYCDDIQTEKSLTAANIYTIQDEPQTVEAVGFGTMSERCRYTITIYQNPREGKPFTGRKVAQQSGTLRSMGFRTVKLKQPFRAEPGETYSVAVRIKGTGGSLNSIMVDHSQRLGWCRVTTKQTAGQSYIRIGKRTRDLAKYRDYIIRSGATARIKMYTNPAA